MDLNSTGVRGFPFYPCWPTSFLEPIAQKELLGVFLHHFNLPNLYHYVSFTMVYLVLDIQQLSISLQEIRTITCSKGLFHGINEQCSLLGKTR